MKCKKLLISSMFMVQIASAESTWWTDVKEDVKHIVDGSRSAILHRKLKHIKISAVNSESHPMMHLRHLLDEALDHGPVRVSIENKKIKIEDINHHVRFVKLPADVEAGNAPFTLWYMQHGQHGTDKHYTSIELPATLELKK